MAEVPNVHKCDFPWGAFLATAAVGAFALYAAKRIRDGRPISVKPVEDVLKLCDNAVRALDSRIDQALLAG
jgi:hypothetical protein